MKHDDEVDERPDQDPGGGKGKAMTVIAIVIMVGLLIALFLSHELLR